MEFFAATLPGLEPILAQELEALDFSGLRVTEGGVVFDSDLPGMYRANLWLRTASQVSLRLGSFPAFNWKQLIKNTAELPWSEWIPRGLPIRVQATCRKSRLYHSDAVCERVRVGLSNALGEASPAPQKGPEAPSQPGGISVSARLDHDRCTISLNTSGLPLHQRGYRLQSGKAPLREHLAAGVLLLCGWTSPDAVRGAGFEAFHDPMCGSGTLAIEAALIALNSAPGLARSFCFEQFANFDPATWERCRAVAEKARLDRPSISITASDRNEGAIQMAENNASRARLEGVITFSPQAVSHARTDFKHGLMLCNPPYGKRLSQNKDVRNLYASLGQVFRQRFPTWHFALVTSDRKLATSTGVMFDKTSPPLPHGGLRIRVYQHRP